MNIREAVLADAKGIARVHIDSWKTTYANIVPDEYLNGLSYERREGIWKENIPKSNVFVAENEEGQIVGFSTGGKERTGNYPNHKGELYAIYILKEYQRQGLGKLLLKPIVGGLLQQNITSMLVLVLEENGARNFYEDLGGKKIDTLEVEIAGKKLNELVYGWHDINQLEVNL